MAPRSFKKVFGLAFDVEKAPYRKSGFKPAQFDLGAGKDLFGGLRLEGFADLVDGAFTENLVIVGGNEGRYKDETPIINRAQAIREMLIHEHGISPRHVEAIPSTSNTGGNIAAILKSIGNIDPRECAVVSNHYHLPRVWVDLMDAGLHIPGFAAESFIIMNDAAQKEEVIRIMTSKAYAERVAEEIQGIAHKLQQRYKARTDVPISEEAKGWFSRLWAR